jgi:flagellar biosynthetic protein FliO
MLKGLALCLATLCGLVFILKKLNRVSSVGGGRRLKVLERLPLGQKSSLVLVEVDGVTRLIGIGAETITDLGARGIMRPARITPAPSKELKFQDVLERTTDTREVRS